MFICDTCLEITYLNDPCAVETRDICEICGIRRLCSNIPNSQLRLREPAGKFHSTVSSRRIFQWVTTPGELHRIAIEMEERAKIAAGGTNLTVYVNSSEDGAHVLHIVADGGWINWLQERVRS